MTVRYNRYRDTNDRHDTIETDLHTHTQRYHPSYRWSCSFSLSLSLLFYIDTFTSQLSLSAFTRRECSLTSSPTRTLWHNKVFNRVNKKRTKSNTFTSSVRFALERTYIVIDLIFCISHLTNETNRRKERGRKESEREETREEKRNQKMQSALSLLSASVCLSSRPIVHPIGFQGWPIDMDTINTFLIKMH